MDGVLAALLVLPKAKRGLKNATAARTNVLGLHQRPGVPGLTLGLPLSF